MTWIIERLGKKYLALKEGHGHLFKISGSETIKLASDAYQHHFGEGVYYYDPLTFKSQEDAQQAIIDYEAQPIADEIISNARKTPFNPPSIAIEARVKEMVKEAGE
jgi:hypothetical protein